MTVRLTLAALSVVPAAMAFPWKSTPEKWLLGVAIIAVVILFGWWRGLFVTTTVARRVAMLAGRGRGPDAVGASEIATVALRVEPRETAELPLALIAGYVDRYGIRFDKVRVTSRDIGGRRSTWIGLTLDAPGNLAALSARSPRIPLRDTLDLAARRLADQLRELGWQVAADESPGAVVAAQSKETWRAVDDGDGYLAGYRITVDDRLADTLEGVRTCGAGEVWTAIEFTGSRTAPEVAAACALRTPERPGARAPLPGLTPERGRHGPALAALAPTSDRRLSARPVRLVPAQLAALTWPTGDVLSRT